MAVGRSGFMSYSRRKVATGVADALRGVRQRIVGVGSDLSSRPITIVLGFTPGAASDTRCASRRRTPFRQSSDSRS